MAQTIVVLIVIAAVLGVSLYQSVRIVGQGTVAVIERFGRYTRTLTPGLRILMPVVDRVRAIIDVREQVVPFPPQPVITQDNLTVSIDTVIYFQVTDARAAVYQITNYIQAIEQLTVTTLRNIVGGMDLERTLTSRDYINNELRGVLDQVTGNWGIRVSRVELKAVEPPASIQDSMEKQMRADRDRRAAILSAEGFKQSQILTAEGEKQAAVLRAEGEAKARALQAEGEAAAIRKVFEAIHDGNADNQVMAYQYLQQLPKIAEGDSNKLWIIPSEFGKALENVGGALGRLPGMPAAPGEPSLAANGNGGGQLSAGGDAQGPAKGQGPRGDRPPRQRGASGPADDVFFNQDDE
ncbi:MAG: SPFH/Band 7/PHB domain protein [Catenulispora sp.]|nr:SPFH/Band 7/PHB domain protein [Catenulispora sp.]